MNCLNNFKVILVGALLFFVQINVIKAEENSDLMNAAQIFKGTIETKNINEIENFFGDVLCVIDDCYEKDKVRRLLRNKKSWLYSWLFTRERSVLNYFKSNKNIEIKIYDYGEYYGVSYVVEGLETRVPPNFTFKHGNNGWAIVEMYIF